MDDDDGLARPAGPRVDDAFFEDVYRRSEDPWRFASEPVELARYDDIVALLGSRTFECAFEPGCSVGVLTARLATRCGSVLALDVSPSAVARARFRCAAYRNVTVSVGRLPDDIPSGTLDLVVFSEIGYYFERPALAHVVDRLAATLAPDGLLVACHWTGSSPDHVLSGDVVHEVLDTRTDLETVTRHRRATYLLASFRPRRRPSVVR